MYKKLLIIPFLLFFGLLQAQSHKNLRKMKPEKGFENIHVQKLDGDAKSSAFVIWIRERVRLHKHAEHSETVYILKGKGTMLLGGKTLEIKAGDLIFIPENTPHSVQVRGGVMQVLSVQAPEFKGKDRIFLE